jgi:hypothetical protein
MTTYLYTFRIQFDYQGSEEKETLQIRSTYKNDHFATRSAQLKIMDKYPGATEDDIIFTGIKIKEVSA